jgi:hypothetical protein
MERARERERAKDRREGREREALSSEKKLSPSPWERGLG